MYKLTDLYKQLKEEEAVPTEPTPQYTLYCDMDGVLRILINVLNHLIQNI